MLNQRTLPSLICHPHRLLALSCLFHRHKVPGLLPLVTKADQSVRRTPALAGVSVTDNVLFALQWEWQLLGQAKQGLVLCAV